MSGDGLLATAYCYFYEVIYCLLSHTETVGRIDNLFCSMLFIATAKDGEYNRGTILFIRRWSVGAVALIVAKKLRPTTESMIDGLFCCLLPRPKMKCKVND